MAWTETFDVSTPDGDADDPREADDRMREIKAAIQERMNVDHYWPKTGSQVSNTEAGEHRKVILRVTTAPTEAADKGILYAKDVDNKAELFYIDEDGDEVQLTTGGMVKLTSAALLGILANDTWLTAVNAAGDGTRNLIKAGADDKIIIPYGVELTLTTNLTIDAQIVHKKYVDDQIAAYVSLSAYTDKNSGGSVSMVKTEVYKAATDGIVAVKSLLTTAGHHMIGYVGTSNPPTSPIQDVESDGVNRTMCFTFPVAKDEYFKITTQSSEAITIRWKSFGTLSAPVLQ